MKRGLFIAIEGTDGSGKATQFKLLTNTLKRVGYKFATVDFPQYGKPSAWFVEQYLNGKYGKSQDISPQIASIFYALDRFQVASQVEQWLKQGKIVVANRYVLSNAAHQGGKIKKLSERRRYWQWLFNLEYKLLRAPKPDINILLHLPAKQAQRLVLKKTPRRYIKLGAKRDIHELDLKHLQAAEKVYLELAKIYHLPVIECIQKGRLLTPKEIHYKVWKIVERKLTKIVH